MSVDKEQEISRRNNANKTVAFNYYTAKKS